MKKTLLSFGAGLLFAAGLGVGGMTHPGKVVAFLDIFGNWDPSLAFVMAAAIATYATIVRIATRRRAPVYGGSFPARNGGRIDARLLLGASVFGLGWGVAGLCPGPAIVSVATGDPKILVFGVSMLAGVWIFRVRSR